MNIVKLVLQGDLCVSIPITTKPYSENIPCTWADSFIRNDFEVLCQKMFVFVQIGQCLRVPFKLKVRKCLSVNPPPPSVQKNVYLFNFFPLISYKLFVHIYFLFCSGCHWGPLRCWLSSRGSGWYSSVQRNEEAVWQFHVYCCKKWNVQVLLQQWILHLHTQDCLLWLSSRWWSSTLPQRKPSESTNSGTHFTNQIKRIKSYK